MPKSNQPKDTSISNKTQCIRLFADVNQIRNCKARISNISNPVKNLSKLLALAGNEVRLKILYLLHAEQKLCVCDLSDILEMNVSAISQHLRKLKDGGVVSDNKDGQTIFYSLRKKNLDTLNSLFERINNTKIKEKTL